MPDTVFRKTTPAYLKTSIRTLPFPGSRASRWRLPHPLCLFNPHISRAQFMVSGHRGISSKENYSESWNTERFNTIIKTWKYRSINLYSASIYHGGQPNYSPYPSTTKERSTTNKSPAEFIPISPNDFNLHTSLQERKICGILKQ